MLRTSIDKIVSRVVIILMTVLVLDVVWQVASRYLLGSPSSFTDELAGFLLIWVGLLGAAYVVGLNKHLAIDYFIMKASSSRRRMLLILQTLVIVTFFVSVMVIGGAWLVYTRFYLGQISPALQIPLGYVYTIVPISGLLIVYYAFDNLVKTLKST